VVKDTSVDALYEAMGGDVIVAELTGQALYAARKEEEGAKLTHAEFRAFLKVNKALFSSWFNSIEDWAGSNMTTMEE